MPSGMRHDSGAGEGGRERERLRGLDKTVAVAGEKEGGARERAALERGREVGRPDVEAGDGDEASQGGDASQGQAALLKADHTGSDGGALAESDDAVVRALQQRRKTISRENVTNALNEVLRSNSLIRGVRLP